MPLGRCMSCDRLVPIKPLSIRAGSREAEWYPAGEHNYIGHADCHCHIETPEDPNQPRKCDACGCEVNANELTLRRCATGHLKAIR